MGSILTAPSFVDTFNLNSSMEGLVTAIFMIGCFIGSMTTAFSGSRFGRRTLAHVGTFVICAGSVLQSSSYNVAQLIVGRIVAGIGLGLIASNVAIWQSETAPPRARGMLIACSLSLLIVGQLIAYWLEYGVSDYPTDFSWRFPMAFQAAIALLMSALMFFMPECKFASSTLFNDIGLVCGNHLVNIVHFQLLDISCSKTEQKRPPWFFKLYDHTKPPLRLHKKSQTLNKQFFWRPMLRRGGVIY